jgi:hypothetical protein
MRILAAVAVLALFSGCVSGPVTPTTTSTMEVAASTTVDAQPADCNSLAEHLRTLLDFANHCSLSSDCSVISEFHRCGVSGCYSLINSGDDLTAVREAADAYDSGCQAEVCDKMCIRPPGEGEIGCVGGRCVDARMESTTAAPQTGVIRECKYTMGKSCGKCYCLDAGNGCEIAEWSAVGDLGYALNRTVQWEGSRENLNCTRMCPCQVRLTGVTPV